MHVEVYSDGSATTKDKPGGYGWVMVIDGRVHAEGSGHMAGASNNDAEMEAAIQGLAAVLKYVNDPTDFRKSVIESITLVSDSQLILGWASGVYRFKQQDKLEKYKQLEFLMKRLYAKTRHVKGHSGDEHNERCDKLANEARLGVSNKKDRDIAIAEGKTVIGTKKNGCVCVWYKNCLKVIDLETNVIENYDKTIHGSRGSMLEVREDKAR